MFTNIGGKIKKLAVILCWIGIIVSVIASIILWNTSSYNNSTIAPGFVVLIGGTLVSWIGSFFTYAIGVIAENSERQSELLTRLCEEQKNLNRSK